MALTMTAGAGTVSRDSPPAFTTIPARKHEGVPHLRDLVDAGHDHGTAVMIRPTRLDRRTRRAKGDWLPVLAPGPAREPAHCAQPRLIADWDIDRVLADFAAIHDADRLARTFRAHHLCERPRQGVFNAADRRLLCG